MPFKTDARGRMRITAKVPVDIWRRMRMRALRREETLEAVLLRAVEGYLAVVEREDPPEEPSELMEISAESVGTF